MRPFAYLTAFVVLSLHLFANGITVKTSGGQTAAWTQRLYDPDDLWAYQPVRDITPPASDEGTHPIDAFLVARLRDGELELAPLADRRTLIRRATFDLTGLPPTPEEIEAFVRDPEPDTAAFDRLIDRLLQSPHYGEQYGRHWLDVVRYADSSGFANDFERPNAWRYRDYVIRSFQNDKPYDRFVKEQLAGDEWEGARAEGLVATGFLRMGPWEQTAMSVPKITRQQFLDDVTDSVGQVFLGHALQCARCHDHKFDPVPAADYYGIQAVFATTQFATRPADWLPGETRPDEEEKPYFQARIARYEGVLQAIREKQSAAARRWCEERGLPPRTRVEGLQLGLPENELVPADVGLEPYDLGMERIARKHLTRHRWELDRFQPLAFSVYTGPTPTYGNVASRLRMPEQPQAQNDLEETAILIGGDPFSRGAVVRPGVLSAVPAFGAAAAIPETAENRRLRFAEWVAHEKNPLTARVLVNRLWLWHFGQGLAGNPNNLGATGKKPTHPELLDWLANQFIESGWSIKAMHRLIMSSEAYRRASHHPEIERLREKDPHGTSHAVFAPRRLTAEELRDAMLAVSGELNHRVGGLPARPDINLEVALQPRMIMGTYAPSYQPHATPTGRNRRSVYTLRWRGLRDPFLEVFNQPGFDKSCEGRETSTVTPQALTLLNGDESHDRSLAFAARLTGSCDDDREALRRAFLLAYGREPSAGERDDCLAHWHEVMALEREAEPAPRVVPREITRQVKEEVTGETFTFTEVLDVHADYQADLQPHETDARTRALADVCLALFNSNEFVYVY